MESLPVYSDEQLVRLYENGDNSAFEILLARHKDSVYTYIYSFIKEEFASDDIFQETFIKVINCIRRGDYTESGKFKYWVLRIAHNLVIDHLRLKKNFNPVSVDEDPQPLNDQKLCDGNIEDLMVFDQTNRELAMLVEQLPPSQREIITMRFYKDMSFKEIAVMTGVSINTSLGRMRYALINLRKMIREKHISLEMEA